MKAGLSRLRVWLALVCFSFCVLPIAIAQSVTLSPNTLSFTNQAQGTPSAIQKITLKNGETTSVTIDSITSNLSDYTQGSNCPVSPTTLGEGKSCTISVTFTPATLGARSGTLTVTYSGTSSPQTISLNGTGVAAVTVSASDLSFGSQPLGLKSAASSITVTNNQNTPLAIASITTSLSDYSRTATCPITPNTLAAKAHCSVSVFFDPSALGTRAANLTISDNANISPTVSLTGTGIIAAVASPGSLTFPAEALGTTSTPQTVLLTNNQSTPLILTSITSSLADFGVTSTCPISPATLMGGGSCTASVTFSPKATGARSGTLSFKDKANNSPQTTSLSGTGAAASLVSIAVAPAVASVALGKTQPFTATGTYSNGSSKNLTSSATWNSSVPGIASIGSEGLATALAAGTTSISATAAGIRGSADLTVQAPTLVSISVTPSNSSIPAGTNQQFTAIGTFSDGSTQNLTSSVNWTSSSTTTAAVNASGLANGASVGSTAITATSGAIAGAATLTVGSPLLVSIAVTPVNPSFALGTTQPLVATGTYTDGSTLNLTGTATWTISNSNVAYIASPATATSVGVGTTTVTAASGSISGGSTLTVTPAVLTSIAITPAIPTIPLGTTQKFTATGTFTNGTVQDVTQTVQWSSDTLSVATISNASGQLGVATSAGTGVATITVSSGTVSANTTLTVTSAALVSIAISPANPAIALGTTQQFTATGTFTDGSTQDLTATATWSSDSTTTASVSNAGVASAVAVGTANIVVTLGSVEGTTGLIVTPAQLISIAVNPQSAVVPLGVTQAFTATGTYTDGTSQDVTQSAHWSSTNFSVATISNSQPQPGLATPLAVGSTTIQISSGTITASAPLTVNPAALVLIQITPQASLLALGTNQQFTATGTYTDGTTENITTAVNWMSSSAAVMVVSNATGSNGFGSSAGGGSATIAATFGSVSSSTQVTVGPPALVSIAVAPAGTSLALGYTQQFTATATYTDGSTQDVTQSVTWSSSVPAVASISGAGFSSTLAVGTTMISAASGSVTGSASLTINSAVPVSLSITPSAPSVYLASQQQFNATLQYSDGTFVNVTNTVAWSSSTPGVASISSTGLADSSNAGSTLIEVMWGANLLAATTTLTVMPPVVTVTPASAPVAIDETQPFSAIVTGSSNTGVTWSVDGIAGGNSSVGTISTTGLYTAPLTIGAHTIGATALVDTASIGTAIANVGTVTPVASTFFGIHVNSVSSPIPGTMVGTTRVWDSSGAQWPDINTSSGVFTWTGLDNLLAGFKTSGINDVLYTLWRVPQWASSSPADTACAYAKQGPGSTGECDLPTDLNADGTGTDLIWRTWVQNIAQHVNSPSYLTTHAKISYWEPCNECYHSPTLDPGYDNAGGDPVSYRGTYAQLVRMMQDARCVIIGNWNDPITALNTTCGQVGYPVTGIDPTAKMVMPSTAPGRSGQDPPYAQVMQNLLYCTCSGSSCSASSTGCTTGSAGSAAIDILSVHIEGGNQPEQIPTQMATIRSYLSGPDLNKPFWLGEGGWGQTSISTPVNDGDPDLEAAWLARFYLMAWATGLNRDYWYEWDNSTYGTLWTSASSSSCPTPFAGGYICGGGTAYQQVYNWLLGASLTNCSANGTTWTCSLSLANGSPARILWDTSQTCGNGVCSTIPVAVSSAFTQFTDLSHTSYSISGTVPVGIKPVLLTME